MNKYFYQVSPKGNAILFTVNSLSGKYGEWESTSFMHLTISGENSYRKPIQSQNNMSSLHSYVGVFLGVSRLMDEKFWIHILTSWS
jgi:hypothetical protein